MGPLCHERRLAALESLVADARERGATIAVGGDRAGNRGFFFSPTVVAGATEGTRLMKEEPFGPIAVVSRFSDFEDVISRANSLPFGLASYVFTRSQGRAQHTFARIGRRHGERQSLWAVIAGDPVRRDILGFPGTTRPGLLDDPNHLGIEYRWVARWIALDKTVASRELTRIRWQWFAKRESITALLREVLYNEPAPLLDTDAANKAADAETGLLGNSLLNPASGGQERIVHDPRCMIDVACPLCDIKRQG
jgi:hypothetical protein